MRPRVPARSARTGRGPQYADIMIEPKLPYRFLIVCTANVCRSPMGEVLLRARLGECGIDAIVSSSGHVGAGMLVSENSVIAMAERGLQLANRTSVVTDAGAVGGADLILTMGREHVRKVIEVDPGAWPRTFPLRVLVRRALEVGARGADELFSDWVSRLHAGRRPIDIFGSNPDDEIADPMGMALGQYQKTAAVIDDLLSQLVSHAFGAAIVAR